MTRCGRALAIFFLLMVFPAAIAVAHNGAAHEAHKIITGPKISFEKELHDFGRIVQGDEVVYLFKFVNLGDETLIIKKVEPSCGCTAVLTSSDKIKPGESGTLKVNYDSVSRSGKVERKIFVDTNDPVRPEIILKIIAVVDASMHDSFKAGVGLFSAKCNKCHGEPAEGLVGGKLFQEVCTFCHKYAGDKEESRAVTYEQMKGRATKELLIFGIPGTEMPGFGKSEKGPLDENQIKSLLEYINN